MKRICVMLLVVFPTAAGRLRFAVQKLLVSTT